MNVLSIDGGGIRGIVPARVLVEIERLVERPLDQVFDLMVGTSTGGLLALALAVPGGVGSEVSRSASALLELYKNEGHRIFGDDALGFQQNPLRTITTLLGGQQTQLMAQWARDFRKTMRIVEPSDRGNARYSAVALEQILLAFFGNSRLSDARKPVIITSYDMANRQPVRFSSDEAKSNPGADAYLRDVGRATSAAPTYFPPYEMQLNGGSCILVDGGVVANNPSIIALLEAFRISPPDEPILLVSLGTGSPKRTSGPPVTLEALKGRPWLPVLFDLTQVLFDAGSQLAEQILSAFAQSLPHRLNAVRFQAYLGDVSAALDDASPEHIRQLVEVGERLVNENQASMQALAQQLAQSPRSAR